MSSEQNIDVESRLQIAKKFMDETCDGTSYPVEFIKAKALIAIAEVLIYIAENGVGTNG
jgi:hypothetical protein